MSKKIIFERVVGPHGVKTTSQTPDRHDIVSHLYSDKIYGDVFVGWNKGEEDNRVIYFGKLLES